MAWDERHGCRHLSFHPIYPSRSLQVDSLASRLVYPTFTLTLRLHSLVVPRTLQLDALLIIQQAGPFFIHRLSFTFAPDAKMKYQVTVVALAGLAAARDLPSMRMAKREVPQEHSHEAILSVVDTNLKLNNPQNIQDAVFSLLGNAAAAKGAPEVANLDCLQQIVADQAFTNAKAAGDVNGQANAIMFRALERNTGSVGLASVLCNETAKNPEIAAITQHQDPASAEASGNKQIALDVATQLASIGADPNLAIQTGTFAPGQKTDNTGKGNTCDDANDAAGCIVSQNLLVPDVTEAEIATAVAGVSAGAGAAAGAAAAAASNATADVAASNSTGAASSMYIPSQPSRTSKTEVD